MPPPPVRWTGLAARRGRACLLGRTGGRPGHRTREGAQLRRGRGTAAGGRGDGRRVKSHPAVVREPHLDPRVRVDVAHQPLVVDAVARPGREAGRDPRRQPAHPQQQRHRARELLAVAALVVEQEVDERIAADRRRLVVDVAVRQIPQHALHERIWGGRASGEVLRERVRGRVGTGGHHRGDVRLVGGGHGRRLTTVKRTERDLRELLRRGARLRDRQRQVIAQRDPWVGVAGRAKLGRGRVR